MKKGKKILIRILSIVFVLTFASCSAKSNDAGYMGDYIGNMGAKGTNEYYDADSSEKDGRIIENTFVPVEKSDTSTFSADVDTASYAFVRGLINNGTSLDGLMNVAKANLIRTEELVNYFDYKYAEPTDGEMFGATATIARTPWNEETYLLMLGLKAKDVEQATSNNLVFLIDVSGSMSSENKLPLLKKAFSYLVDQLDGDDTVSIVTYASGVDVVLDGAEGNKSEKIMSAVNKLKAKGSTYGEAGIKKAYEVAETHMKPDGNNRIIIASDGDMNVGVSDPKELEKLIETKRNSGVFLSVLGFGNGNYRDDNMSAIAQKGNGVYYYIDSEREAQYIFGDAILSTLYTVAKDVKFQLKFDKEYVREYRLIGYENRLLNTEDFDDDTKDAGEVGAGHTLTVCYELKLTDNALTESSEDEDSDSADVDWMKLSIRYKEVKSEVSELREINIGKENVTEIPDDDFDFATSVIEFAMLINRSAYANKDIRIDNIIEELEKLNLDDSKKKEFCDLLKTLNINSEQDKKVKTPKTSSEMSES